MAGKNVHDSVWPLLAATGGRPRDILVILMRLHEGSATLSAPATSSLLTVFYNTKPSDVFQSYLLPSMLSVPFTMLGSERKLTQFGLNASDPALLNADELALEQQKSDQLNGDTSLPVPAVSLQYVNGLADPIRSTMVALVDSAVFARWLLRTRPLSVCGRCWCSHICNCNTTCA